MGAARAEAPALLPWAAWAGQHALVLYGVLLAAVLGAAFVGWWVLRRTALPAVPNGRAPLRFLLLRLAAGFLAVVVAGWVFSEIAEALRAPQPLGQLDEALTAALRESVPLPALRCFAALTLLGNTSTLVGLAVIVASALLATGRRGLALAWVAAVAGNGLLNVTLKQIFQRIRPWHDDGLVLAEGYSFPSGHSSGAVVACGMLAYLALRLLPARWHLPVVLAAAGLAFSIGASRVFLRVHFASDVLAGFASGTAWLVVCIASIQLTGWVRETSAYNSR